MSDEQVQGGLFKGPDGKLSGRKLRAWISFGFGMALLVIGALKGGGMWEMVIPAGVALVYSLIESGFLTIQTIQGMIAKAKP